MTAYYELSLDTLLDNAMENKKLFLYAALLTRGIAAIDVDHHLWGSVADIDDDMLYLCVTDGYEIEIDGEFYDPEEVLQKVYYGQLDPEAIEPFLQKPDDTIINRYINFDVIKSQDADINNLADVLMQEGYVFTEIVKSLDDEDISL